jgi:hypothetical protein
LKIFKNNIAIEIIIEDKITYHPKKCVPLIFKIIIEALNGIAQF